MLSDDSSHRYWHKHLHTFPLHNLNPFALPADVKCFLAQVGLPSKTAVFPDFHPIIKLGLQRIGEQLFLPILQVKDTVVAISKHSYQLYQIVDGECDYVNPPLRMFVRFITELDLFLSEIVSKHRADIADMDVKALVNLRHKLVVQNSPAFVNRYSGLWFGLFEDLFYELKS